jgi:hypothetical protein
VRLHRIDENLAGEMSALLGELRALQREHHVAIVLVHHVRKNGSPRGQDGQSLRGSGDRHAWGDSNLYLRRRDGHILLPSSIAPRLRPLRACSNSLAASPRSICASSTTGPSNATWQSTLPARSSRCWRPDQPDP